MLFRTLVFCVFFLTVRFALFLFYAIHAVLLDAPAKKYACLVFACTPNVFVRINAKRGENQVKQGKKNPRMNGGLCKRMSGCICKSCSDT